MRLRISGIIELDSDSVDGVCPRAPSVISIGRRGCPPTTKAIVMYDFSLAHLSCMDIFPIEREWIRFINRQFTGDLVVWCNIECKALI